MDTIDQMFYDIIVNFLKIKNFSLENYDKPLTGKFWGLSGCDLAYFYLELKKRTQQNFNHEMIRKKEFLYLIEIKKHIITKEIY